MNREQQPSKKILTVRLAPEDYEVLEDARWRLRLTQAAFIREAILEKARAVQVKAPSK